MDIWQVCARRPPPCARLEAPPAPDTLVLLCLSTARWPWAACHAMLCPATSAHSPRFPAPTPLRALPSSLPPSLSLSSSCRVGIYAWLLAYVNKTQVAVHTLLCNRSNRASHRRVIKTYDALLQRDSQRAAANTHGHAPTSRPRLALEQPFTKTRHL